MLFVGDDWAEDHHDVEVQDESGRRLAKARLPEGVAGMARLHALIGEHLDEPTRPTPTRWRSGSRPTAARGCGRWSRPATGCSRSTRCRRRGSGSGTACRAPRATPATRTRWPTWSAPTRHQLRPVAGDSELAEAVKVVARAHKTLIWERTRHVQRLRHALREYFPAALEAFDDLTAADALELLAKAPDPAAAARLTRTQITAALRAGPAPARGRAGRADPDRAARRAARPAAGGHRRLRGHRPQPGRGADHAERRDRDHARRR